MLEGPGQERMETVKDRRAAGLEECRTGGMQDGRDAGHVDLLFGST